jgi:tripartite ATP-independent transporter DctM subunit
MAVGFTICTGVLFGWLCTAEQLGPTLAKLLFLISSNKYVVILLINILLLVMGMVIEAIPIILLMTPILYPVATSIGLDPVQFGVMMCLNLMIGLLTPPIGLNLFIMSTIGKVSIEGIIKELWPFLITLLLVLALIVIFPGLVLWLPNLLVG